MAYTETTTRGWGERLGGAFKGIITGFIIIALGTVLLWWNEERTFKTAGAIGEAQLVTEDVEDISRVDPSLDGKVIHAAARAETKDILRDPIFGAHINAIKLTRKVEYYQWRENSESHTRKKLGGGEETVTTYTYSREWVSSPIDSGAFHDPEYANATVRYGSDAGPNDVLANIEDDDLWAKNVTFGAYNLPDRLIHSIQGSENLNLDAQSLDISAITGVVQVSELYAKRYLGRRQLLPDEIKKFVHVSGSTIYLGMSPNTPHIGDVRVTFSYTPMAQVSIIAKVFKNTFEAYKASNGYDFIQLSMGAVSMEKMFEGAKSANNIMAWLLRLGGLILVIIGLKMILAPLSVLADVIPILGSIVGAGAGFVAFLLGLAWSLIVIAIAWIRFRPIVAGCLIAAAVAIVFFTSRRAKAAA